MQRVYFQGTREQAMQQARQLKAMLSGNAPDTAGVGRSFLLAIGFAALSDIKDAFITKSRGGTDEMGITWKPLSREYLAYGRRFGPGEQAALKRSAGLGRGHNQRGLLNAAQNREWKAIFKSRLVRFLLSMPEAEAKAKAAQIAWATLKRRGAQTKLDVFGSRQVDMLRDTGVLFNSLSPGELSPDMTNYTKPAADGGEQQVFDLSAGKIIIGTNVKYAGRQNAQRKFLPASQAEVPQVWWDRWLDLGSKALEVIAARYFNGPPA